MISALFPAAPPRADSFEQKSSDARSSLGPPSDFHLTESSQLDRLSITESATTRCDSPIGGSFGWRAGRGGWKNNRGTESYPYWITKEQS